MPTRGCFSSNHINEKQREILCVDASSPLHPLQISQNFSSFSSIFLPWRLLLPLSPPCYAPTAFLSNNRSCCSVRCSISSSPMVLIGTPRSSRLGFTAPKRRNVVVNSTVGEVSFRDPTTSGSGENEGVESLKLKLLSVVSGLNRGLVASVDDLQRAETAAKELEAAGGPVDLTDDLDKLQGKWRLLYSSAFSSRSLGGSRPGLPTGRLIPVTLGQVFQRIDVFSKDFDIIAEVEIGAPWPFPPVEVTATLAHKFELLGTCKIKITFEKTTVKTSGNLSQIPPFDIPRLPDSFRPPSNPGTGDFEVTYVDENMRITRGDRGELRIVVIA